MLGESPATSQLTGRTLSGSMPAEARQTSNGDGVANFRSHVEAPRRGARCRRAAAASAAELGQVSAALMQLGTVRPVSLSGSPRSLLRCVLRRAAGGGCGLAARGPALRETTDSHAWSRAGSARVRRVLNAPRGRAACSNARTGEPHQVQPQALRCTPLPPLLSQHAPLSMRRSACSAH